MYIMETKPFRSEPLVCGCCGNYFKTWEEYVDQDQDTGYGVCTSCQEEDMRRNKEQLDYIFNIVYNALSEENRRKIDEDMQKHGEERKGVIVKRAIEEGLVKFDICKKVG